MLSLVEVADTFSVSEPTVRSWIKDGCPVVEGGSAGKPYKFDGDAVLAWRREREAQAVADAAERAAERARLQEQLDLLGGSAEGVYALSPKARSEYYDSEAKRMAVARQRGELVERAAMVREIAAVFAYIGDRLQALPDDLERAANLQPDATARAVVSVDAIQAEIAERLAAWQAATADA